MTALYPASIDESGNIVVGNFVFDVDQSVGAGQDDYVLTFDNSTGLISLEASAGGVGNLDPVVIGSGATGPSLATTVGVNASAIARGVAVGEDSRAPASGVGIGYSANASSTGSIAIGATSSATGNGIAIGRVASAADDEMAIGSASYPIDQISFVSSNGVHSLASDGAQQLALRNGTNAQAFRVYGTYTDASNHRRLEVKANDASGDFEISSTGAGTGVSGNGLTIGCGSHTIISMTDSDTLGFFDVTPVAQPSGTGETTGFTAGSGTGVNDDSTFTGNVGSTAYRISDIVKALKNLGLLAS